MEKDVENLNDVTADQIWRQAAKTKLFPGITFPEMELPAVQFITTRACFYTGFIEGIKFCSKMGSLSPNEARSIVQRIFNEANQALESNELSGAYLKLRKK